MRDSWARVSLVMVEFRSVMVEVSLVMVELRWAI